VDGEIASKYIGENFEPSDRLAIVLLNKRTGSVTQRITSAERIAGPEFQAWLRYRNAQQEEIYISMNTLQEVARGRTKADIQAIRHIYLDLDKNGTETLDRLIERPDMPLPNYQIGSSPGKWQVVWKVEGFTPQQAEHLQKLLARETGADPAATDCTRVLRLPGFYNHKYVTPHLVMADAISGRVYRPQDFADQCWQSQDPLSYGRRSLTGKMQSQSERDWAYAKRALSRGEAMASVIAAIADYRRNEKAHPEYYAALTVQKAAVELAREQRRDVNFSSGPER
jgi:RepB DNA-primase from phage plasmid